MGIFGGSCTLYNCVEEGSSAANSRKGSQFPTHAGQTLCFRLSYTDFYLPKASIVSLIFAVVDALLGGVGKRVCAVLEHVVARSGGDKVVDAGGAVEGQIVASSTGCWAQLPERPPLETNFVTSIACAQTTEMLDALFTSEPFSRNQTFRIIMTSVFEVQFNPVALVFFVNMVVVMEHSWTFVKRVRVMMDIMTGKSFRLSLGIPLVNLHGPIRTVVDHSVCAKGFWFPDFVLMLLVETLENPMGCNLTTIVTSKRMKLFAEAQVLMMVVSMLVYKFFMLHF